MQIPLLDTAIYSQGFKALHFAALGRCMNNQLNSRFILPLKL